jgi:hypothetical protein
LIADDAGADDAGRIAACAPQAAAGTGRCGCSLRNKYSASAAATSNRTPIQQFSF